MATFTFMELGDEEQILDLAKFVAELKEQSETGAFYKSCSELVSAQKPKELLLKIASEYEVVFKKCVDGEIESYFSLIFYLIPSVPPAELDSVIATLIKAVVAKDAEKAAVRLSILSNLYNTLAPSSRYPVFEAVVQYAMVSNNLALILPSCADIETLMKDWSLSEEQQRSARKLGADALKQAGKSVQAHKMFVSYLQGFEKADVKTLRTIKGDAVRAVVEAIQIPDMYQIDYLLELASIRQLESDSENSKAFHLLRIFATEKLDAYTAFHKDNKKYLADLGLDHDANVRKLRLLSLASLAAENEQIEYKLIAKFLEIDESDVEQWIILAIKAKLLEARMDQLARTVFITRCTQREFTQQHWQQLADTLKMWTTSVGELQGTVRTARQ